jgi:putative ABC transport system permease protein
MRIWVERAIQDIRYATRTLRKAPGFTLAASGVLALGIGATTALYSLVDAALVRPLPYRDASRLVWVAERAPRTGFRTNASPLDFLDWRAQNHSFAATAAVIGISPSTLNEANGTSETVLAQVVSSSFFDVLGVPPILGRTFVDDDDRQAVAGVVISERLWRRRFNADPRLVDHAISLGGRPVAVLGVVPADFQFYTRADVWTLFLLDASRTTRLGRYVQVVARLRPGVSLADAQTDMAAVAANIARIAPETNANWGAVVRPLQEALLAGELRTTTVLLGDAVTCVLLLACANVAILLLSRGTTRTGEMAIRAALGGSRARVVQQLLTESLVLATGAGVLGVALAWAIVRVLPTVVPTGTLPDWITLTFDMRLLLFAVVLTVATAVVFGVVPSCHAARVPLAEVMRAGGRSSTHGGRRLRAVSRPASSHSPCCSRSPPCCWFGH